MQRSYAMHFLTVFLKGQHTNKKLEELSSKVQSLQSDMAKVR